MSLDFYYHPLASFCHKVLIALYENETPFAAHIVDLMDPSEKSAFLDLWPVGKMPVLRDNARDRTVPETSIIIEYLDQHYPGKTPFFPEDETERLDARLWDRFYDLYVQQPMQAIVADRLRPETERHPRDVENANAALTTAYGVIEKQMAGRTWAIGEVFTVADCAASPALFYAGIIAPFPAEHQNLAAYFERLLARPSFERVLREAQPYFDMFPFKDKMPDRFLKIGRSD